LLDTKELEQLVELVRRNPDDALEQVSHHALEPAAKKLEKIDAAAAARLWKAMGMRIVNAGKSRYYSAALRNFERARQCYAKAGLEADWQTVVSQVRAEHQRKYGRGGSGAPRACAGAARLRRPSPRSARATSPPPCRSEDAAISAQCRL